MKTKPTKPKTQSKHDAFNLAWFLSLDPQIQRIVEINDPGRRKATAVSLAQRDSSLLIDDVLIVGRGDPFVENGMRLADGYQWVPSLLMPPVAPPTFLGADGSVPGGGILVSTDPSDYPAFDPPRTFAQKDFFAVKNWCDTNGFFTQNPDRRMILGSLDAEDATVDNLQPPAGPMQHEGRLVCLGALPKYGLAFPGKIVNAEELALVVNADYAGDTAAQVQAVADFLGVPVPNIPDQSGDQPPTAVDIDQWVGPADPNNDPLHYIAAGSQKLPAVGSPHRTPDGKTWTLVQFATGFGGDQDNLRWKPSK